MDKLKPIIKHHFWLVFLVTLCLPPVAWWMTSSALSKETEDRETALNSIESSISPGTGIPNDDWIKGVNGLVDIRKEQNRLALDRLWQAQVGMMIWPPNVKPYMEQCPYRGELDDQRIREILPDLYRDDYQREVRRVWMLTEPVFDGQMIPDKGVPRKVAFPYAKMPRVPDGKWQLLPPTWPEIWNSQEDLWLLSELFRAVNRVNAPTTGIVDSYIKAIVNVELFGGSRLGPDEIATAPGGDGDMSMPGMEMPGMPGGPGGPGGRIGAGGTTIRTQDAVFDLSQEYKVFGGGNAARGPGGLMMGPSGSGMPDAGGDPNGGEGADPNLDENRYVASENAYRTRGFRLQVAIHQMQVPELIRELLNCQYPVEIIRFQQKALNPDEPGGSAVPGRGVPGRGFPGGPGGSGAMAGFPGSGSGAADAGAGEDSGFDPSAFIGAGADGVGAGAGTEEASGVVIQTALGELDIVDLVIVGELYLYNPPIIDEDGDGVADEPAEGDGSETAADGTVVDAAAPADPAAVPGTTPGAVPATPGTVPGAVPATPGTVPGTTPAPDSTPAVPGTVPAAPGTTPGTTPAPVTPPPGTETPAPGTPPAETPATPTPGTETPATPATSPGTVPATVTPPAETSTPATPANTTPATPPESSE